MSLWDSLFLSHDQKAQAIASYGFERLRHQNLWDRHNAIIEGNWTAADVAAMEPALKAAMGELVKSDAARQQADILIKQAIGAAIAAGKLTNSDLEGSGLQGLPALVIGGILAAFASVGLYSIISLFTSSNTNAQAQLVIAEAIARQIDAGKTVNPNIITASTQGAQRPSAFSGAGIAAVGIVALFLLTRGKQ